MMDGFNGWRLVINEIRKGRGIRLQQIRKVVRNPKSINKLEDVSMGITHFDRNIKLFEAVFEAMPQLYIQVRSSHRTTVGSAAHSRPRLAMKALCPRSF